MKRKIIKINEDLCNGCGNCVTGCAEGALQIIDGKAKLVKEDFCDGMGDCIGTCPTGALVIEEREVPAYDEDATREHVRNTSGEEAVKKFDEAQKAHAFPCGGSRSSLKAMSFGPKKESSANEVKKEISNTSINNDSQLGQWPVQLHLVNPTHPHLQNREMVVMSTCAPLASANVHGRYLRDHSVVVACPKLDKTDPYVSKLADIMQTAVPPKIIIVRMEVLCCGGLTKMVQVAHQESGVGNKVTIEEHTMSVRGELLEVRTLV